jgi:hypothetical protein
MLGTGFAVGVAGPAQADPSDCSVRYPAWNKAAARCTYGTGEYRAYAQCADPFGRYTAYGPWVRVDKTSTAVCQRDFVNSRASGAGVQVR